MKKQQIQKWALTMAVATFAMPFAAAAQEACTTYTVKDGDSLGAIAQKVYGTYDYQNIFNANRDALANNPNALPPGMQLILPCEDGRLTADTELNTVITQETAKQETTKKKNNTFEPPLKFVTSNNWMPFTDEKLTGGESLFVWPRPPCSAAATTVNIQSPISTTGRHTLIRCCPAARLTFR